MSEEETKNRLKTFLKRNKARISGPTTQTEQTPRSDLATSDLRKSDTKRSHYTPREEISDRHLNSKARIPTESSQTASGRDFDTISFEYQPVSLFTVIGNGPYQEVSESARENSTFLQTQQSEDYNSTSRKGVEEDYMINPFTSQPSFDKRGKDNEIKVKDIEKESYREVVNVKETEVYMEFDQESDREKVQKREEMEENKLKKNKNAKDEGKSSVIFIENKNK